MRRQDSPEHSKQSQECEHVHLSQWVRDSAYRQKQREKGLHQLYNAPQHSSQQSFMIKSYRNLWNGGLSHFELLL